MARRMALAGTSARLAPISAPSKGHVKKNFRYISIPDGNRHGYARAISSGVKWVAMFVAASERFNKANGGKKISKTMDDIQRPAPSGR